MTEVCEKCKSEISKLIAMTQGKSVHACANVCEKFPYHCSTFNLAKYTYYQLKGEIKDEL